MAAKKEYPKTLLDKPRGEPTTIRNKDDEEYFRARHLDAIEAGTEPTTVQTAPGGLSVYPAQEAAEIIRQDLEESPALDPGVHHTLAYCTEVCKHLHLDPNPINLQRVADALKDAGIQPGAPHEYPKWLGRDEHGHDVIADDEGDEAKKSPLVVGDDDKKDLEAGR